MLIHLEVAGDVQISRRILRVGKHATDARPAFAAIADFVMAETDRQFQTEGAHASGGWQPIKAATLRRKQQQGLDPRILHATHALRDSLTRKGDRNQILRIRRQELVFGSRLPYATVHQNPRAGNPLPRRRPIELTERARRRIVKILQRWIITGELA